MPANYSRDRLGERVLDLLDDMNDWGQPKKIVGEADLFELNAESELYGHLNVNYLRLDDIPKYEEGWDAVLESLRTGQYFTSTGEVLIPSLRINGKEFTEQVSVDQNGQVIIEADLAWTFPLVLLKSYQVMGKTFLAIGSIYLRQVILESAASVMF